MSHVSTHTCKNEGWLWNKTSLLSCIFQPGCHRQIICILLTETISLGEITYYYWLDVGKRNSLGHFGLGTQSDIRQKPNTVYVPDNIIHTIKHGSGSIMSGPWLLLWLCSSYQATVFWKNKNCAVFFVQVLDIDVIMFQNIPVSMEDMEQDCNTAIL